MRALPTVIILALSAVPGSAQSRPSDETALRGRVAAFEAAINKRDLPALAALYASDADLIVMDGPVVQGRAAIQAATQKDWSATPTRRISLTVVDIRFLGADMAIINTRAQFNEGPVKEDRGTWAVTRQPGGPWLIAALRVMPAAR
jgi:uncharacterized protein (TIGR02246 family)